MKEVRNVYVRPDSILETEVGIREQGLPGDCLVMAEGLGVVERYIGIFFVLILVVITLYSWQTPKLYS